jgi:putative intracellular protease/amidase
MTFTTAILAFDDVQIIDYTGPFEVFGRCGPTFLVAEKPELTTNMGMKVTANHTFADAPVPDVLVVPGGGSSGEEATRRYGVGAVIDNEAVIDFIRRTAAQTMHVLSVCNGAFLCQRAGLLDGLTATTTAGYIPYLAEIAPLTSVVRDQRVVDNGKVVVTGGLSAGIDGALTVVEKIEGKSTAIQTALNMEYDWRPDDGWSRAALADAQLPYQLYGPIVGAGAEMVEFRTSLQAARELWLVPGTSSADDLIAALDATWDAAGWARSADRNGRSTVATSPNADDSWLATVEVASPDPSADVQRQRVTISIRRPAA